MLHGSEAGRPVAEIGLRRGRRAYAAALAGCRHQLRTTRSLPSRDSHPHQFLGDWSLSAITSSLGIVWVYERLIYLIFDARDAFQQRQERHQA